MNVDDKGCACTGNNSLVEPNTGVRGPLSSNKAKSRTPVLDFNPKNKYVTNEVAIDYLASLLVKVYIHMQKNAAKQKGSDLRESVNKGASR